MCRNPAEIFDNIMILVTDLTGWKYLNYDRNYYHRIIIPSVISHEDKFSKLTTIPFMNIEFGTAILSIALSMF